MKTKRYALLMLCSSLLLAHQSFAQNDFIETLKGDTIRGKLKIGFALPSRPEQKIKFKKQGSEEFEVLSTDSLKSYFRSVDSVSFVRMKMPYAEKAYLVKKLENGRIQLFEDYSAGAGMVWANGMGGPGGTISTWYANLDGGELLEIKTNSTYIDGKREQREKNLFSLFVDDQGLLEKFKKRSYTFENIRAYIKKYNKLHSK